MVRGMEILDVIANVMAEATGATEVYAKAGRSGVVINAEGALGSLRLELTKGRYKSTKFDKTATGELTALELPRNYTAPAELRTPSGAKRVSIKNPSFLLLGLSSSTPSAIDALVLKDKKAWTTSTVSAHIIEVPEYDSERAVVVTGDVLRLADIPGPVSVLKLAITDTAAYVRAVGETGSLTGFLTTSYASLASDLKTPEQTHTGTFLQEKLFDLAFEEEIVGFDLTEQNAVELAEPTRSNLCVSGTLLFDSLRALNTVSPLPVSVTASTSRKPILLEVGTSSVLLAPLVRA